MGAVYRAIDTRLNRVVALKVLPADATSNAERQRRFVQEAQSASALNHPNIVNIYAIENAEGVDFIAMEYVDGQALDRVIADAPLPVARALDYAIQIAAALAAAHGAGILHRDIKPANILLSSTGNIKVLDFGLAKLTHSDPSEAQAFTRTATPPTASGIIVGTAAYMSPEQAEGQPVDARTDIFSFGATLYELLAGRHAFQGRSPLSTLAAVLHEQPTPLHEIRANIPATVEQIVARCLEKDAGKRYASAAELKADLEACRAALTAPPPVPVRSRVPMAVAVAALIAVLVASTAAIGWFLVRNSRVRWARNTAVPEIEDLIRRGQSDRAYALWQEVQRVIPDDPLVARLREDVTDNATIASDPPGTEVFTKLYLDPNGAWIPLGTTPLREVPVPFGFRRWRFTKEGYEPRELASGVYAVPTATLSRPGAAPDGMVHVTSAFRSNVQPPAPLEDFWLDKYEVTNRQFKAFVDAGGYTNRAYWKQPFLDNGRTLTWDDAMRQFDDATGRAGPSTWELGTYAEGQAELPVTGVSWYEAAAYAEYAGKSLPTFYHWNHAAARGIFSDILPLSNFGEKGLARVGEHQGLGAFGTYDMAGNAKEWCFNSVGTRRYILGAAWNEPSYMYTDYDAQAPFERKPNYGFRCAKYPKPLAAALMAPVETAPRDYTKEHPATDAEYRIYASLYDYDPKPLNATVQSLPEDSAYWRREKVAFDAVYGGERIPAFLFLPRNTKPPFQTVVYVPPGSAYNIRSSAQLETRAVQFLLQSGRAVMFPIYSGTYDRWYEVRSARAERDLTIQTVKDFRRSIEYLETRSDVDKSKLAFYGISSGSVYAPILLAGDQHFKAAVLLAGGFPLDRPLAEVDPINFAPRVTVPVLMLNGRLDFAIPVDLSQRPLFQTLGTAPEHKQHTIFETGHAIIPIQPMIKGILDWLDRYLGAVTITPGR